MTLAAAGTGIYPQDCIGIGNTILETRQREMDGTPVLPASIAAIAI